MTCPLQCLGVQPNKHPIKGTLYYTQNAFTTLVMRAAQQASSPQGNDSYIRIFCLATNQSTNHTHIPCTCDVLTSSMIAADHGLVRGSKVSVFCALFAACGVRGEWGGSVGWCSRRLAEFPRRRGKHDDALNVVDRVGGGARLDKNKPRTSSQEKGKQNAKMCVLCTQSVACKTRKKCST